MLRIFTIFAFLATLGMAGVVYKLKYEARALQLQAAKLQRDIRLERNQLAVAKAEWSIVTKPEYIEDVARGIGLSPLKALQIITPNDIDQLPLNKADVSARWFDETSKPIGGEAVSLFVPVTNERQVQNAD